MHVAVINFVSYTAQTSIVPYRPLSRLRNCPYLVGAKRLTDVGVLVVVINFLFGGVLRPDWVRHADALA